jgi:hypothetical protein
MERSMKRMLALFLAIAACVAALDTSASATGQRMHKPIAAARLGGYEPPDPCFAAGPGAGRCAALHHVGGGSGSGKVQ